MMYEYQHRKSGEIITKYFSAKGTIPDKVIEKKKTYRRIYSIPTIMIDSKRGRTLGSVAEKNTTRMLKEGKIKPKVKEKPPWWRPGKTKADLGLTQMSNKQKVDYVLKGKR